MYHIHRDRYGNESGQIIAQLNAIELKNAIERICNEMINCRIVIHNASNMPNDPLLKAVMPNIGKSAIEQAEIRLNQLHCLLKEYTCEAALRPNLIQLVQKKLQKAYGRDSQIPSFHTPAITASLEEDDNEDDQLEDEKFSNWEKRTRKTKRHLQAEDISIIQNFVGEDDL